MLYSPPYLNAVMQNCCIRKSKVSHQMYSTRVMGDACIISIVDKAFHHFCVLLCHMGFHRNTVIFLKIASSLNIFVQLCPFIAPNNFNNVVDKNR